MNLEMTPEEIEAIAKNRGVKHDTVRTWIRKWGADAARTYQPMSMRQRALKSKALGHWTCFRLPGSPIR